MWRTIIPALWAMSILATGAAHAQDCAPGAGAQSFVFVGIDHYLVTDRPGHGKDLKNLSGPENDVVMIKAAIASAYGVDLTARARGSDGCERPGGRGVTLIGACATRQAVLGALLGAVGASRACDTVMFYFAGHGAEDPDTRGVSAGQEGAILPVNARRDPNDAGDADIAGWEIDAIVRQATSRGVNLVTVFDSCHSAAATRGAVVGVERVAPPMSPRQRRPAYAPPSPATSGTRSAEGYHVHLAGAAHDGVSWEAPIADLGGEAHGLFTYALSRAILQASQAPGAPPTYQQIMDAALTLMPAGYDQSPYREGPAQDAFLGAAVGGRLARALPVPAGGFSLDAGTLSGVTQGSTYGLFATPLAPGAAGPEAAPVAVVDQADPYSAHLRVTSGAPPGGPLWAREISHRFGDNALKVRIDLNAALKARITTALGDADIVQVVADGPQYVLRPAPKVGVAIYSLDRHRAAPGRDDVLAGYDPANADFADKVKQALIKIATYHEVLDLVSQARGPAPGIAIVGPDDAPGQCGGVRNAPNLAKVRLKQPFDLVISNPPGRYLTLIQLLPDFAVQAVWPPRDASQNIMVPPDCPKQFPDQWMDPPAGHYIEILLSTSQPVYADDFNQSGVRGAAGDNPLTSLLARAQSGRRGPAATPTDVTWGAARVDLISTP